MLNLLSLILELISLVTFIGAIYFIATGNIEAFILSGAISIASTFGLTISE